MLKFKVKNVVPPGGKYPYFVEETKSHFESYTLNDTYWLVCKHMGANNIPIPKNLKELIEDYVCRHVPESFCLGDDEQRPRVHALTFFNVMEFTGLLFKKLVTRREEFFAPQTEAVRRADICRKCPENNRVMCTSCNGLKPWAAKLVSNRKTNLDKFLGVCTICGCVLAAKVHVNAKFLLGSGKKYPSNCWLHEAAEVDK